MSKETLLSWLRYVIDESQLHTRSEWGHIIGVSPQAQGRWLSGKDTPRPETLRRLLAALRDDPGTGAHEAMARWERLATRALAEVSPGSKQEAATLAHLVVEPLWNNLQRTARALPPEVQEKVLADALRASNRHVLQRDRRGAAYERAPSDLAHALEVISPEVVTRYGGHRITRLRQRVRERRSFWSFREGPS